MKNKFIIILVAVLLLVVGLSGCNENKTDNIQKKDDNFLNAEEKRFVGCWVHPLYDYDKGEIYNTTLTFFSNGEYKSDNLLLFLDNGTYEAEEGEIIFTITSNNIVDTQLFYNYTFFDNDQKFILTGGINNINVSYTKN